MLSSHDHGMLSYTPRQVMVDRKWKPNVEIAPNCPRCDSPNTKFCYYNNYSLSQPRYFCKGCRRYWTKGGSLRNVPVGGGCRKNRRGKANRLSTNSLQNSGDQAHSHKLSVTAVRPDVALDAMIGNSAQFHGMDSSSTSVDHSSSNIDLAVLYAKYLNHCPETSEPAEGMHEIDHESTGSVGGFESRLGQQFQVQLHDDHEHELILDCQSFDHDNYQHHNLTIEEAIVSTTTATIDHDHHVSHEASIDQVNLCVDFSNTSGVIEDEQYSVEFLGNYFSSSSSDCLSLPSLISEPNIKYQEFGSVPIVNNMPLHQNIVSCDHWSTLDCYSNLEEEFYVCHN